MGLARAQSYIWILQGCSPPLVSLLSMPRREVECTSRVVGVLVILLHAEEDACRALPKLQGLGWMELCPSNSLCSFHVH